MAELATLRTAKLAVNEGLITQDDFDLIKVAFLKASQIKAGLDAGFIREEDYEHARESFLHSLDFAISHTLPAAQAPTAAAARPGATMARPASSTTVAALASTAGGTGQSRFITPPRTVTPAGPLASAAPPPAQQAQAAPVFAAPVPANASSSNEPAANVGMQQGNGNGTAEIPADLGRFNRGPSVVGKKSMAGIGLHDQSIAIFNCIKTKAAYKWVTYKIDDAGHEVVIDVLGAQHSTFEDFVAALPPNQSRYGVYDYAYTNADTGSTVNKLVFIHWAPDSSSTRSKMMYASTKDFFKGFLDGVGAELQATEVSELSDSEMRDRVHQAITRK